VGKSAGRTTNVAETSDQLDPASDDFAPRISWRGDSAHFAVSCVDPSLPSTSQQGFKRVVRFYSRVAKLQATSEASPGMEHALAWQPSGSIIASTMRSQQGGRTKRDVIFFERNGLRRYDFPLRADDQTDIAVKALSWNADSSILAVWLDRQGQHSGPSVPRKAHLDLMRHSATFYSQQLPLVLEARSGQRGAIGGLLLASGTLVDALLDDIL
jgi:elongator complex protein 1